MVLVVWLVFVGVAWRARVVGVRWRANGVVVMCGCGRRASVVVLVIKAASSVVIVMGVGLEVVVGALGCTGGVLLADVVGGGVCNFLWMCSITLGV